MSRLIRNARRVCVRFFLVDIVDDVGNVAQPKEGEVIHQTVSFSRHGREFIS